MVDDQTITDTQIVHFSVVGLGGFRRRTGSLRAVFHHVKQNSGMASVLASHSRHDSSSPMIMLVMEEVA